MRSGRVSPMANATDKDGRPFAVERVPYDGQVWCPTTPSGTWLAWRNGTVCWTGNTDSETWAGRIHPHQALQRHRREVNPHAKLVVVGMTATNFSIADPADAGMLDIAGFDAATPTLLADFARGD
ncbi:hypothetical protein APR08_002707 [Nocardia amikacinitolerans]|nr:hypothetical protein [Nocardia amikacinitolerans]